MVKKKAPAVPLPDSDLAKERADPAQMRSEGALREEDFGAFHLSALTVTEAASHRFGRPAGRYLSLDFSPYLLFAEETAEELAGALSAILAFFLSPLPSRVLVAGLGNRRLTADAYGPLTAEGITATAALPEKAGAFGLSPPVRTAVYVPDVLARTGIDSVQSVCAAARLAKAEALIAIDALATAERENLLSVLEITDTGTVPGGGVKQGKEALSRASLGIPVTAIGLPTVVRADAAHFIVPRDLETGVAELARITAHAIELALSGHAPPPPFPLEELFSKEKP